MSNTIRINTTPNGSDKYLKVKLEQDWDYIEILSLKISQEETYQKFCSDYGAIVGRVQISGVGVPNAKVSVFIPLDDTDKNNPLIKGIYPYETITDKNSDGIRYNLLPKDGDTTNICATPIGTFPNKREVLDNETILQVYCKYYKFTTTTNHAGDFMLFGVPLGTHVVHIDADVSDIGILSQRPYDLISQGTPKKYFSSSTKFNSDKNLDKLVQVKSMNSGVNVQPFWGDTENCEIGINRLDFELNYTIIPSAIFMGSIYGDQDKNSINKRCVPRKKLGVLCEQIAGTGTIDMIRQTIDGSIEEFSVDGGQLIDEDGTWAYQIPMNLDYVVTSEYGTLIPSKDSNTGIATRARVRFKIGMDETGGEGRIRTRAKYLVPNNPNNQNDVDYTFGSDTKDSSFKDLHWNKIYTVSNYISRFQRANNAMPISSRSMTAIKDVDACAGDKTPFPYNRLNTEFNPLFGIICIIMRIMSMIIYMLNIAILPLINDIVFIINFIINKIITMVNLLIQGLNSVANLLGLNFEEMAHINIPYIPCISIICSGSRFAPGCVKDGGIDGGLSFSASTDAINYYYNDGIPSHNDPFSSAGLTQCVSLEMAKTLNMFQFDFYNDWVNGSLFGFLIKYKKKKSGSSKFCEYECNDFPNQDSSNNNCHNNILLDTCFSTTMQTYMTTTSSDIECQLQYTESSTIREGLVKKVGNDLYYAATTHNTHFKLFATDIISLGSVFSCDWQGIPKINDLLIPTTYKLPPDIDEEDDNLNREVCGMLSLDTIQNPFNGGTTRGLFFFINCDGIHINKRQCLNLKHICEIGVDIDETQENGIISDCIIGSNDIDENNGKFFRNTFTSLNIGTTNTITSTNFNIGNAPRYDFTSANDNDPDYIKFRGYSTNDQSFGQTKHSYFFYFGLLPGKTALDKMNEKFFTTCEKIIKDDILIKASTTPALIGDNGSLTFNFVGGKPSYTYTITGIDSTSYGPTTGTITDSSLTGLLQGSVTINNLQIGTYLISGYDSLATPVNTTVTISGPTPLYCVSEITKHPTVAGVNDGEITITSVGGGIEPYHYEVRDGSGALISGPSTLIAPQVISNLGVDVVVGYSVRVYDSATPIASECTTTGLVMSGPTPLVATVQKTDVTCYGGYNGSLTINVTGGQPPYTIHTTGVNFSQYSGSMNGILAGTYVTNIVDSLSATLGPLTTVITQPVEMKIGLASAHDIAKQCDPTQYVIPFYYIQGATANQLAGVDPLLVQIEIDGGGWLDYATPIYLSNSSSTPQLLYVNVPVGLNTSVHLRLRNNDNNCFSSSINIFKAAMELPMIVLAVTPIDIQQQCVVGQAKLGVIINDLSRAPYSIDYTIDGVAGPTIQTFSNINNWTAPVTNTSANIVYTVTDVKGCIATTSNTVKTPSTQLTCNVTTTGTGPYIHIITGFGGIGAISGLQTITDNNLTITATITDSVGCTATKIG